MTRLCAAAPATGYEDGISETLADKIIDKEVFSRRSTSKDKVKREILLHKDLIHPNIVRFHNFFSDGKHLQIFSHAQRRIKKRSRHLKCIFSEEGMGVTGRARPSIVVCLLFALNCNCS